MHTTKYDLELLVNLNNNIYLADSEKQLTKTRINELLLYLMESWGNLKGVVENSKKPVLKWPDTKGLT